MFPRSKTDKNEKLLCEEKEEKIYKDLQVSRDRGKALVKKVEKLKEMIISQSKALVELASADIMLVIYEDSNGLGVAAKKNLLQDILQKNLPVLLSELKSLLESLKGLSEGHYSKDPCISEDIFNCNEVIKVLKKDFVDNNDRLNQQERKETGLDGYEGYGQMNSYEVQAAFSPFIFLIKDYENQQECKSSIADTPRPTRNRG